MLNEAPNNNDVTRIVNIMLNEAPNSNDVTHIDYDYYLIIIIIILASSVIAVRCLVQHDICYMRNIIVIRCLIENNVHLTAMGAQQFSMAAI